MEPESAVADIIAELGVTPLARALGHRNVSTVSSWKLRGSIPAEHWKTIVEFARSSGADLTYERLAEAHAHKAAS